MDARKFGGKFLEHHITKVSLLTVTARFPTSSFKGETIDISSSFRNINKLTNVINLVVSDIGSEAHFIEGLVSGTSSDLHNSSKEGHRVEETRYPKYNGGNEFFRPSFELRASQNKIIKPDE